MRVKYKRRSPQSWESILLALNTASTTSVATPEVAKNPLTADHKAKIDRTVTTSFLSVVIRKAAAVEAALAAQGPITREVERLAPDLRMICAHFHQVMDFGILRQVFPSGPGARSFYGRDLTECPIPALVTYDDLEKVYKKIVSGETARATAEGPGTPATLDAGLHLDEGVRADSLVGGYVPMAMPSAAEVGEVGDAFSAVRVQSLLAQRKTNEAREALQELWDAALALVLDIWDTVEFFYRHDPDPSSFRAKCAEWGVVYIYVQDDEPTPPAPTPPPA